MAAHTWYEVCVSLKASDKKPADSSVHGTLDSVKAGITRFRALYPDASLIFVRHHFGNQRFRILHRLTVSGGSTADERRARAIATVVDYSVQQEGLSVQQEGL